MLTTDRSTPSRELLQEVATVLTREASYEGGPDVRFLVSQDGTRIEFHFRKDSESAVIDVPVSVEDDELHVHLPGEQVACFKKDDLLDTRRPIWNN